VQRGFVQRQAVDHGPEVQHIVFERTLRLEALEDILAEMDRERSLDGVGLAAYRARATTLLAMATQLGQQAQMLKHLLNAQLLTQECKGDLGTRSAFRRRRYPLTLRLRLRRLGNSLVGARGSERWDVTSIVSSGGDRL
jgi:hypothetical protein